MKPLLLLGVCVLATPAFATDFTYSISTGFDAGAHDWITTNCDNCALTAANIVGWSLSQTLVPPSDFTGPLVTASSLALSSAFVQGAAFLAKPTGLFFDFNPGDSFGNVMFKSGGNSVQFTNSPDFMAVQGGAVSYCSEKNAQCFGSVPSGMQQMGTRAKATAAPELGSTGVAPLVTVLLGMLAVVTSSSRRLRRTALPIVNQAA